jgi:periplasmic divalent cation tolerance protein
MSFLLLYVTHPSKPEAIRLSIELLNQHLIACVNYYPIESMYWWEWQLTKSDEVMTIYKLKSENYELVKKYIEEHHTYKVPGVIRLATVEANASYEDWIQNS